MWTAGTLFLVEAIDGRTVFLRPVGAGMAFILEQRPKTLDAALNKLRKAQFDALANALVPTDENLDAMFERLGIPAYDMEALLEQLIERGALDRKRFEAELARWLAS